MISIINSNDWQNQSDITTIFYPAFFSEYCHFQNNRTILKAHKSKHWFFFFLGCLIISCYFLNVHGLLYSHYENNILNVFFFSLSVIALKSSTAIWYLQVKIDFSSFCPSWESFVCAPSAFPTVICFVLQSLIFHQEELNYESVAILLRRGSTRLEWGLLFFCHRECFHFSSCLNSHAHKYG